MTRFHVKVFLGLWAGSSLFIDWNSGPYSYRTSDPCMDGDGFPIFPYLGLGLLGDFQYYMYSICILEIFLYLQTSSVSNDVTKLGEWSVWNSWSPCSRTCGTGVATRTRTCHLPYKYVLIDFSEIFYAYMWESFSFCVTNCWPFLSDELQYFL